MLATLLNKSLLQVFSASCLEKNSHHGPHFQFLAGVRKVRSPLFYIVSNRRFRKAFLDALTVLFAFPCRVVSHCMSYFR